MNVFDKVEERTLEYVRYHVNSENVNILNSGKSYLYSASRIGSISVCRYLISIGADPSVWSDCNDGGGGLPLHIAAKHVHVEIVKLLVDLYRDGVNIKSPSGRTPLWLVCNYFLPNTRDRIAVCKVLLDAGALFSGEELDLLSCDYEVPIAIYLLDRGALMPTMRRLLKCAEYNFVAKRISCQYVVAMWIWMFRKRASPLLRVIGKDMVFLIAREVWRGRHTQEFYDFVGDLVE